MATTEAAPTSNKTWKLTLYEKNRKPQEVLQNDIEVKVSPRSLHAELMCPICLDMLKNTMTTKECLHRFCQECITTALRSGNKECPTCRKKLVSRRSLRSDPTFDALINKIYPNRAEYEAHEERALAKLSKHHSTVALMNSIEEGMKMQALFRSHRSTAKRNTDSQMDTDTPEINNTPSETPNRNSPVSETSDTSRVNTPKQLKTEKINNHVPVTETPLPVTASTSTGESSGITQNEIELTLRANNSTQPTDCKYIKTTDNATVEHLKKYLSMRSQLHTSDQESIEESRFHVFIRLPDHNDELAGEISLRRVNVEMWKQNKPLELYYISDHPMDT